MLDAGAAGLAFDLLATSEFVQAGPDYQSLAQSQDQETPPAAIPNTPPSNVQIDPIAAIDENGVAQFRLTFDDSDLGDTHTVEIDWGDGTPLQTLPVASGARTLNATHPYLDDNPTTTASDSYTVKVRVLDDAGDEATASATVTVNNVAPTAFVVTPPAIFENGFASVLVVFNDPGTLDTHKVEINWGDGSTTQIFNVPPGPKALTAPHQYLDDNPTGTPQDNYTITVRVLDDDSGVSAPVQVTATVGNLAPSNVQIAPLGAIAENGTATLNLAFTDPGSLDEHTVEIDWGDGTTSQVLSIPVGDRTFSTTHQYLDDNAADEYVVTVRVRDDDGGVSELAPAPITVTNVAPAPFVAAPPPIFENGIAVLLVSINDPGTLDAHDVEIDWGDGSAIQVIAVPAGQAFATITHQYIDDNPTGTPQDNYTVSVRVRDDDGGVSATQQVTAVVRNLAPSNVQIGPIASIDENGLASLNLTFDDPGSLDEHQVEIDWGDGSAVQPLAVAAGARAFATTHRYLDDNPTATSSDQYTIKVRVLDDDGGASDEVTALATVNNVAPSAFVIPPPAISENGVASLVVVFDDPGTLDSHRVEIDWGDGTTAQVLPVPAAQRILTATHQYLDDNPTGTPQDSYTITVRVLDDDGGASAPQQVAVQVSNLAPSNVQLTPGPMINENEFATLDIAFDDSGTLDEHTVEIDWGDSFPVQVIAVPAGARTLSTTHQYFDDNANDSYTVTVRVRDDDGGVSDPQTTQISVKNVAPFNVVVTPPNGTVNEGSLFTIKVSFDEVGPFDSHTYSVDWGDGRPPTEGIPIGGGQSFAASHIYADNGQYTVKVTITDDDGDSGIGVAMVTVVNVAPTLVVVGDQTIAEGSLLSLPDLATFSDPGFDNPANTIDPLNGGEVEESFKYTIDWGDSTAVVSDIPVADQNGGELVPSTGAFGGSHTYADNGTYTVTVTIRDDDDPGGVTVQTFTVVVTNVDPTLKLPANPLSVFEGDPITLSGLQVQLQDPGFDNAANKNHAANGGEFEEVFTAVDVDWGDGTSADLLSIGSRTPGSVGVPTIAEFVHPPHVYADNGTYTVTVRIQDDDGPEVTRTFTITVVNVAPTLDLTDRQITINEGDTLSLPDLGTFEDAGFDNAANTKDSSNGGEIEETFTYTINWGDGTVETGQLPATRNSGQPGITTKGTLVDSHRYLDNDADNKYTITVTLSDDDGGVVVDSFVITVRNVNPTLDPISATDVNSLGQTTLQLEFEDPGADEFVILVDWGDGVFVPEQAYAGPTPQSFTIVHTYLEPPDPDNPADDILIRVLIQDDDFGTVGVVEPGQSNLEFDIITNPGTGNKFIRIDTSPKVPLLSFPVRAVNTVVFTSVPITVESDNAGELGGSGGESNASTERYLELVMFNPDGSVSGVFQLAPEALNNLAGLFRRLPDGYYAIFLVQAETGVKRLVIKVFVREGQLSDIGEGAGVGDRPPTEGGGAAVGDFDPATTAAVQDAIEKFEQGLLDGDQNGATTPEESAPSDAAPGDGAPAASDSTAPESQTPSRPEDADGASQELPSNPAWGARPSAAMLRHGTTLASVALALSAAGRRSWRDQIDQSLAKATAAQRQQLKSVGHWRRKRKPR